VICSPGIRSLSARLLDRDRCGIEILMEPIASRKEVVVLTVEPGETALSTRKLIVESAGFNALSAVTARQAIEIAKIHPVHAALIDVDADDLEMGELIESLRKHRPQLRVFVLSGHGWVGEHVRPHISRVFQKLSDPREFVEELTKAFPTAAISG
jgi:DNA-binding NtrC family response regulator